MAQPFCSVNKILLGSERYLGKWQLTYLPWFEMRSYRLNYVSLMGLTLIGNA